MSTASTTNLTTADEFFSLPNDGQRRELVRGEVRTMTPPGYDHGDVTLALGEVLRRHVREHQLGKALAEIGFIIAHDPDTVLAPDLAFVRKERVPVRGNPKFFDGPPDLAVEVVSPNDTVNEVEDKVLDWIEAGASMVWVVNPKHRRVTVHRSLTDVVVLHENDVLEGDPVVAGFRCQVRELFE
ncbi:MAG TPA: Uma2 family endonuclease [Gemmataceae bacterium]|jgi:Uma2 family endonuclease|nr:Uma2 family endonuclease [Gemmataceae bacterium]